MPVLDPQAAQRAVLRARARAQRADRRIFLVPRIGLVYEGRHTGLTSALRTEGWIQQRTRWFFLQDLNNPSTQRQIRLLLAWAKGNGERIDIKRASARRYYTEAQLQVMGISLPPEPRKPLPLVLGADWGYIERQSRGLLKRKRALANREADEAQVGKEIDRGSSAKSEEAADTGSGGL